jgi:hypothetical protein
MNVRTRAMALAAVAALATAPWLASPAAAASVTPSPAPVPTIAPAQPTTPPIPTPPPNQAAASCTDTSVTGFLLTGRFPIPASSSVSATTEIQILPDTSDARFYLNYTIAQLKQEEAQAQQQGAPVKSVSPAPLGQTAQQLVQQQADATRLSTVLQNLQPLMRGTTVGPFGFWSCSGVPPAASYLLFATLSTTMTVATQATPPPIPSVVPAAVAAAIRQNFGQRQQTTRYYYKLTIHLNANPLTRNGKPRSLTYDFMQWQHVATISQ